MLAGIRADGTPCIAFPEALKASSGLIRVEKNSVHLPLRGQRRLKRLFGTPFLLLPVELFDQNGQTSTNEAYFTDVYRKASTIGDIFLSMAHTCNKQNPLEGFRQAG